MATHENHRRGEKKRTDNGPTWEGSPNAGGPGVARGRAAWGKRRNRSFRRNGKVTGKFHAMQEGAGLAPVPLEEE